MASKISKSVVAFRDSSKAENDAARVALGYNKKIKIDDKGTEVDPFSLQGMAYVSGQALNGLARFAFLAYIAEQNGEKRDDIQKATGLSKQRVSALVKGGRLIARCGAHGEAVLREATAVGEQYNAERTEQAFGTLTGKALADKIVTERAVLSKEQAKRSSGANETADEKAARIKSEAKADKVKAEKAVAEALAKRTPEQRVAAIVAEMQKVTTLKVTVGTTRSVGTMIREALRIGTLTGMSSEDLAGILAEVASAEVAA